MNEQDPGGTPAGWYPHPTMPGTQGYWDGQQWTDHVAPASSQRPAGDATNAAAKVFLILAAVGAIVALLLIAGALVD